MSIASGWERKWGTSGKDALKGWDLIGKANNRMCVARNLH